MRQPSPIVRLGHPFCTLAQASVLLHLGYRAAQTRFETGRFDHLLVRLPNGDAWRPGGLVWLNALKLRGLLDDEGLRLFDSWQQGETSLRGAANAAKQARR